MYTPFVRVRGIDCVAWALWLLAGASFLGVTATETSKAGFATAAALVGLMAACATLVSAMRRAEERVSDQMTIEHRAQRSDAEPTLLTRVR